MMTTAARRVFWSEVSLSETADGWSLALDDRPVRTPAKAALALPSRALAEAVAEEWRGQSGQVRPETMPLTRAANSAIDKVLPQAGAVATLLAEYGATDLICYRADHPEELAHRQALAWDPWLAWARESMDTPLFAVAGVMYHEQPSSSLARLRARVDGFDAWRLTGLHDLVTLSGSLILGLAVADGALAAEDAWTLSRLDETWQEEQWGRDEEAAEASAVKRSSFLTAARFLSLLDRTAPGEGGG